jgi:hypothetical protein
MKMLKGRHWHWSLGREAIGLKTHWVTWRHKFKEFWVKLLDQLGRVSSPRPNPGKKKTGLDLWADTNGSTQCGRPIFRPD